jgi:hypothetical protein
MAKRGPIPQCSVRVWCCQVRGAWPRTRHTCALLQASTLNPGPVRHSVLHALIQRPQRCPLALASPSPLRSAVGLKSTHARAQGAHHEDMRQSPSRDASSDGGLRGGGGSRPGSADRAASRASPGRGAGGAGSHFAGFEADHEGAGQGRLGVAWFQALRGLRARLRGGHAWARVCGTLLGLHRLAPPACGFVRSTALALRS